MGQGQLGVIIYINFVEVEYIMLHAKFHDLRTISSVEDDLRTISSVEDFEGFYHIRAWQPSWSCDLDHLYKLLCPLPKEALHIIWL